MKRIGILGSMWSARGTELSACVRPRLCLMTVMACVFLLSACGGRNYVEGNKADHQPPIKTTPTPVENGNEKTAKSANESSQSLQPVATPSVSQEQLPHGNNIYFPGKKTAVDEQDKEMLRQHALRLKQNPRLVLTLRVHTDSRGSRSYNLAIAEEWTSSIIRTLCKLGASRKQIQTELSGHRIAPAEGCKTTECRQQLRRVELIYKK